MHASRISHTTHDSPGVFLDLDSKIAPGQASVIHLLELCFSLTHAILSTKDPVSAGPLRPIYEKLIAHKRMLEDLHAQRHTWFVAGEVQEVERRIVQVQRELTDVESRRVDGKFVTENVHEVPQGQAVLHFLLHKVGGRAGHTMLLVLMEIQNACSNYTFLHLVPPVGIQNSLLYRRKQRIALGSGHAATISYVQGRRR